MKTAFSQGKNRSLVFYTDARLGRDKTNTDPLCPRVIRIESSTYMVRNHPVGPIKPNGNV
jgi:hypothetical protein